MFTGGLKLETIAQEGKEGLAWQVFLDSPFRRDIFLVVIMEVMKGHKKPITTENH